MKDGSYRQATIYWRAAAEGKRKLRYRLPICH